MATNLKCGQWMSYLGGGSQGCQGKEESVNVSLICSSKQFSRICHRVMLFVYDQRQFDSHFKTVIVGLMILPRNKDSLYLIWKIVNIVPTWVTRWQLGKMAGQMQDDIIMVPLWCLRYTGPSLTLNYLKNIKQDSAFKGWVLIESSCVLFYRKKLAFWLLQSIPGK